MNNQPNQPTQPNIPQEPQPMPQPTPQPTIQPEIPKKQGLPTWAIILIVVGAIIVLAGVSYGAYWYFTSQPAEPSPADQDQGEIGPGQLPITEPADETSDWQIYRNEKYGFEFKYPKDWKLTYIENNSYELIPENPQNCNELVGEWTCFDRISFGIVENSNQLDIKTYLKKVYGWADLDSFIKDFKETEVDGRNFYSFIAVSAFDGSESSSFWVSLENGNFFRFSGSYLIDQEEETFNQILSTFKFIEVDETADWQTYRNEEYGFEVKYPGNWHIRDCGVVVGFSDNESDITGCGEGSVSLTPINISVTRPASDESAEHLMNRSIEWYEDQLDVLSKQQIKLNDHLAIRISGIWKTDEYSQRPELSGVKENLVFSAKNGLKYTLSYNELNQEGYLTVFDQILSTFKFID